MGDTSIMARRLENGYVQYGWSGNGGHYTMVGDRLLSWYKDPEDVEYLFGLGQTGLIGVKGSEKGGEVWYLTHRLTGEPCYLGKSEREIFSQIAFVDYGYFYDLDHKWYYIIPGPFRIKMPMELVAQNLDEREYEFDFRRKVTDRVLRHILDEYKEKDEDFSQFLEEKGYNTEDVKKDIDDGGLLDVMEFYHKYRDIFDYFDDWVLVESSEDREEIAGIIVKKKMEKHIETCEWLKDVLAEKEADLAKTNAEIEETNAKIAAQKAELEKANAEIARLEALLAEKQKMTENS